MPRLLIFDAFTLLIHEKNVANYALLQCKPFSLKIWLCQFLTNIMFAYFVQISYSIYMQVYFIFLLLWVIFVVYVGCWCCLRWRRHWWKICCDCIARGHFGVWWHHYVGTICIMSALSPTFPQQKIDISQTEIYTIFSAGWAQRDMRVGFKKKRRRRRTLKSLPSRSWVRPTNWRVHHLCLLSVIETKGVSRWD